MQDAARILEFLALSERLKLELRHSWLSDGRQESVAEHSWQMALMALLVHRHLAEPVDIGRVLKMVLVHDLVEAEVGDVPFFATGERKTGKAERERQAIRSIRDRLPGPTGQEIHDLWHEYEDRKTPESRFAGALDHWNAAIAAVRTKRAARRVAGQNLHAGGGLLKSTRHVHRSAKHELA